MPNIRVVGTLNNGALIVEWDDAAGIVKTALVLKHELTETRNPTIADDSAQGFERGSFWFNASTLTAFICLNPAAGNSQWRQMAGGGGGTGTSVGIVVEVSSNIVIDGTGALPTIDGYAVQDSDRVLLTAQTSADENGLWIAHTISTAWVRPTDFASGDHAGGRIVFVVKGTAFPDTLWACITDPPNDVIDTNNLAFEQIGKRAEVQIIYVGKHGSDSNAGKSIEDAKLTFGSAITAAGTPGSEAAAVTVVCLDDGEYAEDLTHVGFVYIYAPNATLDGVHALNAGVHRIAARRLLQSSGATSPINIGASAGEVHIQAERIEFSRGVSYPIVIGGGGGPLYLKANKIDTTGAVLNGGIALSGGSIVYLDVGEFYVRDKEALIVTGDGEIYGRVGRLHGMAGSTGLKVSGAGTVIVRLCIGEMTCPTAWSINQANADIKVFCSHVTGIRTETAGKVRVVEAIKNNYAATADPAVGDDTTKGYSAGSRWVNVTADKVFTCLDASTGAAIWVFGNAPRVVRTTDDIEAILEAAGDGSSFWLEDGTHTAAGLILIENKKNVTISGGRGAVVTRSGSSSLFQIKGCEDFVMKDFSILVSTGDWNTVVDIRNALSGSYDKVKRHRYLNLHIETPLAGNPVSAFVSSGDFVDSIVEGCVFRGRLYDGILINASTAGEDASGAIIRGNQIVTDQTTGIGYGIQIDNDSGRGVVIANNVVSGGFDSGIGSFEAEHTIISGNVILDSESLGIEVGSTSHHNQVIGNSVYNSGADGIEVKGDNGMVSNNLVYSATGDGIQLIGCSQIAVGHNVLEANGGYGINVDSVSASCSFESNHYNGNTSGTLNLAGINEHTVDGEINNRRPTTDATVTTIATIPIPDYTSVWIEVNVINRRTNAAGRGKWKRGALVYREAAGVATFQGSVWTPLTVKSVVPAVWDCTIVASGNNALIQVTGAVGHDLNWESRHTLEERS